MPKALTHHAMHSKAGQNDAARSPQPTLYDMQKPPIGCPGYVQRRLRKAFRSRAAPKMHEGFARYGTCGVGQADA